MLLNEALNQSRIQAARGYTEEGKCVVSVANYGGQLVWMTGWGGNWVNEWKPVPAEELSKLDPLDFRPTGPPPPIDDHELAKEIFEEDDEFDLAITDVNGDVLDSGGDDEALRGDST